MEYSQCAHFFTELEKFAKTMKYYSFSPLSVLALLTTTVVSHNRDVGQPANHRYLRETARGPVFPQTLPTNEEPPRIIDERDEEGDNDVDVGLLAKTMKTKRSEQDKADGLELLPPTFESLVGAGHDGYSWRYYPDEDQGQGEEKKRRRQRSPNYRPAPEPYEPSYHIEAHARSNNGVQHYHHDPLPGGSDGVGYRPNIKPGRPVIRPPPMGDASSGATS